MKTTTDSITIGLCKVLTCALFCLTLLLFGIPGSAKAETSPNVLTSNLAEGSTGEEVRLLQSWLAQDKSLYPEKKITGEYGPATKHAVERYQKRQGMITSSSLGGGYGIVGPLTRANLNREFSAQKDGIATVQGSYSDVLRYDGTKFVPLVETTYAAKEEVYATVGTWFNPAKLPARDTLLLANGDDYAIGLTPEGKLYAKSPRGLATTEQAYATTSRWQYISVVFTKTNVVFIFDNKIAEAIAIQADSVTPFSIFKIPFFAPLHPASSETRAVIVTNPPKEQNWFQRMVSFVTSFLPSKKTASPAQPEPVTKVASQPSVASTTPVVASSTATGASATKKPTPTKVLKPASPRIEKKVTVIVPSTILVPVATTTRTYTSTTTDSGAGSGSAHSESVSSAPVITLVGSAKVSIPIGGTYTDPGAVAVDATGASLTSKIVVGGQTVQGGVQGTYVLTYNVTDSAGRAAIQVTREVTVLPPANIPTSQQQPVSYQLPAAGQEVTYSVGGTSGDSPAFSSVDINPLHVYLGDTQTMTVYMVSDSDVASVQAVTKLDTGTHTLDLVQDPQNKQKWSASWVVYDTHTQIYNTVFTATSNTGSTNSVSLAWSDPCSGLVDGTNSSLGISCSVSVVDGLDAGNLTIPNGITLTLNAGSTWAFNPGKSIIKNPGGKIVIANGASLKKGYLFYQQLPDLSYNTTTKYFFTTASPGGSYSRTSTYSQASYYSQSYYQAYYEGAYYSQSYYQAYYESAYYSQSYYQAYYEGAYYSEAAYYSQSTYVYSESYYVYDAYWF